MCKHIYAVLLLMFILWSCEKATSPIDTVDSRNSYIITLSQPAKVTNSYVSLIWTKYPDLNFQEYRLLKKYPGFEDKMYN